MASEHNSIEVEVEGVMDLIRDGHYLSTDVKRSDSIAFLETLISRCGDLRDELAHELLKYGEEG